MRRYLSSLVTISIVGFVGLVLTACGNNNSATSTPSATTTLAPGTVAVATSSIPTLTIPPSTGAALPSGTLILLQANTPLAQLPNHQTVTLAAERRGDKGSPNGHYGVRVGGAKLQLVDFTTNATGDVSDVPQSDGLTAAVVTWKDNSSGFAFTGVPPSKNTAISYYDLTTKKTTQLVAAPSDAKKAATPRAFSSPDGKYLMYAVGSTDSESIGGPGSSFFYLDTSSLTSLALPADAVYFNQWLKDGSGFVISKRDKTGGGTVIVYHLDSLNAPVTVTPPNTSDLNVDLSPDGKFIAVSSIPLKDSSATANIWIMKVDGTNRKQLTKFTGLDRTITALVWGNDGIYYSLHGADKTNPDTTWRMDLDGTNPSQIATGILSAVVGAR